MKEDSPDLAEGEMLPKLVCYTSDQVSVVHLILVSRQPFGIGTQNEPCQEIIWNVKSYEMFIQTTHHISMAWCKKNVTPSERFKYDVSLVLCKPFKLT